MVPETISCENVNGILNYPSPAIPRPFIIGEIKWYLKNFLSCQLKFPLFARINVIIRDLKDPSRDLKYPSQPTENLPPAVDSPPAQDPRRGSFKVPDN